MKLFLVAALTVLVAVSSAHEDIHGIVSAHDKCQRIKETHVHDDVLVKILKNQPVDLPSNFEDHVLCVFKDMQLVNDQGQINHEVLKTHVGHIVSDEEKIKTIVHECSDVVKETPGKTVHELYKCLRKYNIIRGNEIDDHTDEHHHDGSDQHHHHDAHETEHAHHHH